MNVNVLVETENLSREEWLKYRQMGIGGSDVASLIGINKWKSPIELWLEKTGQSNEPQSESEATMWGNIMEDVLRNHFAEVTQKPVAEVKAILQHKNYPFMLANVDGITMDDFGNLAILEIKTASEYKRADWDGGVPAYYESQLQHYLCVTGVQKAYCAVLIGGNSFRIYEVDADTEVQAMLIELEKQFWHKVQNRVRPEMDGSDSAKKLLDSMYHGGIAEEIVLPAEAIEHIDVYLEASEQEDCAKAKKQEASNRIKEFMGDFDKARCMGHLITWKAVSSERLDTKLLKEEQPEIYKKYAKVTKTRRFTLK